MKKRKGREREKRKRKRKTKSTVFSQASIEELLRKNDVLSCMTLFVQIL